MEKQKKRYSKLDRIRGLCLLSMIAYHTVWDLVYIYNVHIGWYQSRAAFVWQQSICWTFILLAGFCLPLGSRPLKRGIMIFAVGALITAVTLLFMPGQRIVFGVLTLLGSSMILAGILDKFFRNNIPAVAGMIGSFLLFAFTYSVNERFVGFLRLKMAALPEGLYRNYFTTFLGFPYKGFFSTDYFPLFPWFFLFLTGYFVHFVLLGKGVNQEGDNRIRGWLQSGNGKFLEWMGRHSLLIYVLHQPLVYGILWVIFRIL